MLTQILFIAIVFGICFFLLSLFYMLTGKLRPLKSCGGVGDNCDFCDTKDNCKNKKNKEEAALL